GVTEGTEAAVLEGMRWLIRHQNDDGSWGADTLLEHCSVKAQCVSDNQDFSPQYNPGLTGLALLAFLGAGYEHDSKQKIVDTAMGKRYVVGDVVGKGLKWLISEQGPDGSFANYAGSMYNEAIGALALSEAYGLSQNPALKEPAEKLINYLVSAQKSNPTSTGRWGWRYTPGGDSVADTSVTGWVVMAFKSAQIAGLKVPQQSFEGAMDFATWVTGENGLVGYLDPAGAGQAVTGHNDRFDYHVATMSSLGMIVRTFIKHDISDPFLELAAGQIIKDLPKVSEDHLSVDYYYWYYGTLALNQFDGPDSPHKSGKYWEPWNKAMQDAVLSLQDKNQEPDVCTRGGWLVGDRWCYAGGPIYATAVNVLTLEVYYRYANAFGSKH
ncbi:MAG TPA: prenyltransferase/squalene oxidase repeat-containing protein, partial [Planctomycetota bacterium]|nr:prenyltransferase/squalene oxidase repeat-containing protein [Planctomycetota bacterium]